MWDEFGRCMHIYICWNLCMKWINSVLLYFVDRAANRKGAIHIELERNILKHRNNYSHISLIQNTTSKYLPVHRCNVYMYNPVFIVDFFIVLSSISFHFWASHLRFYRWKYFYKNSSHYLSVKPSIGEMLEGTYNF